MQIGLGPGHIVLYGSPVLPAPKGHSPLIFGPYLLWPNGRMGQDATWYGGRPRPKRHCARWGRSSPFQKGAQPTIFGPCLLWPNGWMDQDATWYDGRPRPGNIVLDADPAPHPRGTAPKFRLMCVERNGWIDQDATWY